MPPVSIFPGMKIVYWNLAKHRIMVCSIRQVLLGHGLHRELSVSRRLSQAPSTIHHIQQEYIGNTGNSSNAVVKITCGWHFFFYGGRVRIICIELPFLEGDCLGYLRMSAVVAGSHGVGALFREVKPDQIDRKNG